MVSLGGRKVAVVLLLFEVIFIVLFAVFVEYDDSADPHLSGNSTDRRGYKQVEQYYASECSEPISETTYIYIGVATTRWNSDEYIKGLHNTYTYS